MSAAAAFRPTDCQGVCYPQPPGSTIELAMRAQALARAGHALDLCRSAAASAVPDRRPLIERVAALLSALPPIDRARMFGTAAASLDLDGDTAPTAAIGLRMTRHMVRSPGVEPIALALTAADFGADHEIYLPHAHALLARPSGTTTLAIVQEDGLTRLVWSDGAALTLPNDGAPLDPRSSIDRFRLLPMAAGLPVLNGIGPFEALAAGLNPAGEGAFPMAGGIISDSFDLLAELWPTARAAAARHLRGLLLLRTRGHVRSHSPPELDGAIITTVDSPEQLADVLCHEASHVRMNAFRRFDPIARPARPIAEAEGFVSPWRPDLRPLRGLIDGVHAFLNVCAFHRRLAERFPGSGSETIYARQARNVRTAWLSLRREALPTDLGTMLFAEFEREVAAL